MSSKTTQEMFVLSDNDTQLDDYIIYYVLLISCTKEPCWGQGGWFVLRIMSVIAHARLTFSRRWDFALSLKSSLDVGLHEEMYW